MSFLSKVWGAVKAAVASVPGGTAFFVPVIAALAARYGFHVTSTQLTAVMAIVSAVVGYFVHVGVKTQAEKIRAEAAKQQ